MPLQPARLRPWMLSILRLIPLFAICRLSRWPPSWQLVSHAAPTPSAAGGPPRSNEWWRSSMPIRSRETCWPMQRFERYGGDVLDNMVNRHLILQECTHNGIEVTQGRSQRRDPTARRQIRAVAGKLSASCCRKSETSRPTSTVAKSFGRCWRCVAWSPTRSQVTDDEFNRAFIVQFGEAVKCRLIMVADRSKADSTCISKRSPIPSSSPQLAKKFSEDEASASVGGLIPPIRRYSGDSRLEEAAFALGERRRLAGAATGRSMDFSASGSANSRIEPKSSGVAGDSRADQRSYSRRKNAWCRGRTVRSVATGSAVSSRCWAMRNMSKQHPGVAAIINGEQVSIALVAEECIKRHGEEVLEGEINRKLLTQGTASRTRSR